MMASVSAFDQWQKDVFFSAAEAVQESTDTMESVYRLWMRDQLEGSKSEISDELRRELHAALGTAKWQLEEFERAVKASHKSFSCKESRISRHGQFVSAIRSQITRVEKALRDSIMEEEKQPLRWVQLDEDEQDHLAMFLSGTPHSMQENVGGIVDVRAGSASEPIRVKYTRGPPESSSNGSDSNYVEVKTNEILEGRDQCFEQVKTMNHPSRTWSSPDIGDWKIVVADGEDTERKRFETGTVPSGHVSSFCSHMKSVRESVRSKWQSSHFRKGKAVDHLYVRGGIRNFLNLKKITSSFKGRNNPNGRKIGCGEDLENAQSGSNHGQIGGVRRQYQAPFSPSLRLALLFMLTLFLFVPFVFYSS